MKILAAGDIHGDSALAEKLAKKAEDEKVDLVVLCGDLTYAEQSTDNIVGAFTSRKQKVILIPGNHETVATADFLCELYGATNLHGYSMKFNDVALFGAGGANIGLHQVSDDEIYSLLQKGHDKIKDVPKKVMVTHVHPTDSMMSKFSTIVPGSQGVTNAIKAFKPDILLCSHVHEAEGIEEMMDGTKVMNVGKGGKIFEI